MKDATGRLWGCALVITALLSQPVGAATLTTTIPISVVAQSGCSITGTGVDFGTYSGGVVSSTGSLSVNCTQNTPYHVTLDKGLNLTQGIRAMTISTAADKLGYQLYKDAALTLQWGDSDYAATFVQGSSVAGTGTGSAQTLTIYGRMFSQGTVVAGPYSDTVTVTVIF